jgi:uncharacterized protein YkuJ
MRTPSRTWTVTLSLLGFAALSSVGDAGAQVTELGEAGASIGGSAVGAARVALPAPALAPSLTTPGAIAHSASAAPSAPFLAAPAAAPSAAFAAEAAPTPALAAAPAAAPALEAETPAAPAGSSAKAAAAPAPAAQTQAAGRVARAVRGALEYFSWRTAPEQEAVDRARDYFAQKGIPVSSVKYNESSYSPPMSPYDGGDWNPASLSVGFENLSAYRASRDVLPRKIAGLEVYADSAQRREAEKEDDKTRARTMLRAARAYFRAQGVPVAVIRYEHDAYTVSFRDVDAYQQWKGRLPREIVGTQVFPDAKQRSEGDARDRAERESALIESARAYFRLHGIPVVSIAYTPEYTSYGMSPYDGDTTEPESLTARFANSAARSQWKKLPRRIAGIDVYYAAN